MHANFWLLGPPIYMDLAMLDSKGWPEYIFLIKFYKFPNDLFV